MEKTITKYFNTLDSLMSENFFSWLWSAWFLQLSWSVFLG